MTDTRCVKRCLIIIMTDVSSIVISHGEKSDLNEARDGGVLGMQWHQLDHMQTICTSHTHTHPLNGPFSGTTRVSQSQKGKPIWIFLKQETVSGSGIRQITMPTCYRLIFFTGVMLFLMPTQQCQSTESSI